MKTINDNNRVWMPEKKMKQITGTELLPEVNDVINLDSEDIDSEAKSNRVAFNIFQTFMPYEGIVPEKNSLMNSRSRVVNLFSTEELK
jgi:hypothetical protein